MKHPLNKLWILGCCYKLFSEINLVMSLYHFPALRKQT